MAWARCRGDLDKSMPRMVEARLGELWKTVEQSMRTTKDAVANDRFNDQQRSHDLRSAIANLQEMVDSQEQRLLTMGEQAGVVDYALIANTYVDHQELQGGDGGDAWHY